MLEFIACATWAAQIILACDSCDHFLKAIRLRHLEVEMDDGSTFLTVRKPLKPGSPSVPLPPSQNVGLSGRTSLKIKTARAVELPPKSQTWDKVTTQRPGLVVIQPRSHKYERNGILTANCIAQVQPDTPFWMLVSNSTSHPVMLHKNQLAAVAFPHPTVLVPMHIFLTELLGISLPDDVQPPSTATEEQPEPKDNRSAGDLSLSVDRLDLYHVPEPHRERLRRLRQKYSPIWSGNVGDIVTTKHHIDLPPGTRPIAQHPYRADPRMREIEPQQVDTMLEKGLIEPAQSV